MADIFKSEAGNWASVVSPQDVGNHEEEGQCQHQKEKEELSPGPAPSAHLPEKPENPSREGGGNERKEC